mgnify:CR=1 FL=1
MATLSGLRAGEGDLSMGSGLAGDDDTCDGWRGLWLTATVSTEGKVNGFEFSFLYINN